MADMEFHVKVVCQEDGQYFATAKDESQTAYGHGLTALAACVNALANAHLQDFTATEPGE